MGAIFSFLGGSAFRAIWGEFSNWLNARQEHKHEMDRMRLQGQLDAEQHARNMAAQKQQAELGYKTIQVQADADVSRIETETWRNAVTAAITAKTGIAWVDAWNGTVRPAYATAGLFLWLWWELHHMAVSGWIVSAWSLDLVAAVVGFYFADRSLAKRGK